MMKSLKPHIPYLQYFHDGIKKKKNDLKLFH